MKLFIARFAAYLLFCGGLAACGGGNGGAAAPGPTPLPIVTSPPNNALPASNSIYLGVIANTSQQSPPLLSDLTTVEAQIGRTAALTTHYYSFYEGFPGAYEANDAQVGRIPVISWNCGVPDAAIVAGKQDAVIKRQADALRAYGRPVFLRFMWEMNLADKVLPGRTVCYDPATDEPNGQFSPSEYIAAWDHMRAIFVAEGANNVLWLWNPNGNSNPVAYYPGSSEVDWVGVDKYNSVGESFDQTFAQVYRWLAPLGKPIMIGETGAAASYQPEFFATAVTTLQGQLPLVKALCYFDGNGDQTSWILSSAGLAAFRVMASDPYFSARYP